MSKRETYETRTEELITPILDRMNFELVDVEYVKEGGTWYLRAYIDKEGGITVNDCEAVAREMNEILDREDFVEDSYVFEVSSPGLGRPLKKEKDYIRHPRKSGYRSLHIIGSVSVASENGIQDVKVEIQLRTLVMHLWAELDHDRYYKKQKKEESLDQILKSCAKMGKKLDVQMQKARKQMDLEEKAERERGEWMLHTGKEKTEMIDGKLIHKSLKKMPYSGSYHGMRYYLTVEDNVLKTYVYPEPFCFEKTPEEDSSLPFRSIFPKPNK